MAKRLLKYIVYPEDNAFVAQCLDADVASEGDTEHDAVANLREALELYFDNGAGAIGTAHRSAIRFGELVINI
jgi:predicted RNase H-like HicB family nuclease